MLRNQTHILPITALAGVFALLTLVAPHAADAHGGETIFRIAWRTNAVLGASALDSGGESRQEDSSRQLVMTYFPIWNPNSGYTVDDIDFERITHIGHFSVVPRANGSIEIPDWGPFPDPRLVQRAHARGVPVVLVVGGDHRESTAGFSAMAGDTATRTRFVRNLIRIVDAHDYDGVEIDWEYPENAKDRDSLTQLLRQLRDRLGPRRTLSVAGPGSDWYGRWYDVAAIEPYLDWFSSMTYTFAAPSWSPAATHNSALFGPASVDSARRYYLGRGLPARKLMVGIPFYGERFDGAAGLGEALASRAGGGMGYSSIVRLMREGWQRFRDTEAGEMPYLVRRKGPGVIVYDDARSIRRKCEYVKEEDLRGVVAWSLGQDAASNGQPLFDAIAACR